MFLTNINSSDQARFPHYVDTNPDGSQVTTTIITTIITIIIIIVDHHHHHHHQVASPKNLDAAPAINGICQYSDNEELIYDCFINPKYKVE